MRHIQHKLLVQPFAPLLPSFGMTRKTESPPLAGKSQQTFLSTVSTPYPGKATLRITAVHVFLNHILDDGAEVAILPFKTVLIFQEKFIEAMKKYPIEYGALWMTLTIVPYNGRDNDS